MTPLTMALWFWGSTAYRSHVFKKKVTSDTWKVCVVIVRDDQKCEEAVKREFSSYETVPAIDRVTFERDTIVLKVIKEDQIVAIPLRGGLVLDGWSIASENSPEITKESVDGYLGQGVMPCCQLEVKWKSEDNSELKEWVTLEGARGPQNVFHLMCSYEASPCAYMFKRKQAADKWMVNVAIVRDDKECRNAVAGEFQGHEQVTVLPVEFEKDPVVLKICERGSCSVEIPYPEGLALKGWTITPYCHPEISKQSVNRYPGGAIRPYCRLLVEWKSGDNTELNELVTLEGARGPRNVFPLICSYEDQDHNLCVYVFKKKQAANTWIMDVVIVQDDKECTNAVEHKFRLQGHEKAVPPFPVKFEKNADKMVLKAHPDVEIPFPGRLDVDGWNITSHNPPIITRESVRRYPQASRLIPYCQFTVKWNGADKDLNQIVYLEGVEEPRNFFPLMCRHEEIQSLCSVFRRKQAADKWMINVVIVRDDKECMSAVKGEFPDYEEAVTPFLVTFEQDATATVLKINRDGNIVDIPQPKGLDVDGWNITPTSHPEIRKDWVHSYPDGGQKPFCQLEVKWNGGDESDLKEMVYLDGIKEPTNLFVLICYSPTRTNLDPALLEKPEVHELSKVIKRTAADWSELAFALKFDNDDVKTIRQDNPSVKDRCTVMLGKWLAGQGERDPRNWHTLLEALKEIGQTELAKEVISTLTNEVSPTETTLDPGKEYTACLYTAFAPPERVAVLSVCKTQTCNKHCEFLEGKLRKRLSGKSDLVIATPLLKEVAFTATGISTLILPEPMAWTISDIKGDSFGPSPREITKADVDTLVPQTISLTITSKKGGESDPEEEITLKLQGFTEECGFLWKLFSQQGKKYTACLYTAFAPPERVAVLSVCKTQTHKKHCEFLERKLRERLSGKSDLDIATPLLKEVAFSATGISTLILPEPMAWTISDIKRDPLGPSPREITKADVDTLVPQTISLTITSKKGGESDPEEEITLKLQGFTEECGFLWKLFSQQGKEYTACLYTASAPPERVAVLSIYKTQTHKKHCEFLEGKLRKRLSGKSDLVIATPLLKEVAFSATGISTLILPEPMAWTISDIKGDPFGPSPREITKADVDTLVPQTISLTITSKKGGESDPEEEITLKLQGFTEECGFLWKLFSQQELDKRRQELLSAFTNAMGKEHKMRFAHLLFFGLPGAGKSTLIKCLMGEIIDYAKRMESGDEATNLSTGVCDKPIPAVIEATLVDYTAHALAIQTGTQTGTWRHLHEILDELFQLLTEFCEPKAEAVDERGGRKIDDVKPTEPSPSIGKGGEKKHPFIPKSASVDTPTNPMKGESLRPSPQQEEKREEPRRMVDDALSKKKLIQAEKYIDRTWTVYLTDTGGQLEFQEFFSVLGHGPSLYVLLFRLDHPLNRTFTITYRRKNCENFKYESHLTVKEILLQSLASIDCLGKDVKVLILSTHKDLVPNQHAKLCEVDEELRTSPLVKRLVLSHPCKHGDCTKRHVVMAVNNFCKRESDGKAEDDITQVKQVIEKHISRYLPEISRPASWFLFGMVVRNQKSRVLSYNYCESLATKCGIKSGKEFEDVLCFLHSEIGLIRHFKDVTGMKDIVVQDPQAIFDKITTLVTETFGLPGALPEDTISERKRGIFSLKDVASECSADASKEDELLTPEKLVALLQHLCIITPLKKSAKEEVPLRYFMPCVMYHSEETIDSEAPRGTQKVPGTPPLLFTFDCGYLPKGVFGAVITHLEAECSDWRLDTRYTFKNQVCYSLGFELVFLKHKHTHLEITLYTSDPDDHESIRECCKLVYTSVKDAIRQVARTLHYIQNGEPIEPIPAFYCPKKSSNTTPHFAKKEVVRKRTIFRCTEVSCDVPMKCSQIEGCEQWLAGDGAGLPQIEPPHGVCKSPTGPTGQAEIKKPEMYELKFKHKVVQAAQAEWEELAYALCFEEATVSAIKRDTHDVKAACTTVLSKWLAGEGKRGPRNWDTLLKALADMGQTEFAQEIRQKLE